MKKRILSLLLALCLAFSLLAFPAGAAEVTASGTCGDNVTWTLTNDGVLTISGTGPMKYSTSNVAPWDDLRDSITSVVIESGVTSIGDYAFVNCANLTSVTIPDGVTSIGESAFNQCGSLTSVIIPEGVSTIQRNTFYCCDNLKNITIPESVTDIDKYAFYGCNALTNVVIPNGVTTIKSFVFYACYSMTSVTIPESVTSIEESAFSQCRGLNDVYYGGTKEQWKNVSIASYNVPITSAKVHFAKPAVIATGGEGDITWVLTDDAVVTVSGTGVISETLKETCADYYDFVTAIVINPGITGLADRVLEGCYGLERLTLPDTLTSIGAYAFDGCSSLTSMVIPDSVTKIGKYAFKDCSGMTSVNIPAGVTSIEEGTFCDCTSLSEMSIPAGVTSIGYYAFGGCSSLTNVTIPKGVTTIGNSAFANCSSLTDIVLPDGVIYIGVYAFCNCSSLTSATLPDDGVIQLRDFAFMNCSNLTSIIIPDGITTIYTRAFSGCTKLTSVTIPKSVTTVGTFAFDGCDSLTDVYYGGTEAEWNAITIQGKGANDPLINANIHFQPAVIASGTCGENLTWILDEDGVLTISGTGAMENYEIGKAPWNSVRESIQKVVLEDGVTSIGSCAFCVCSMTSIDIPDSVSMIGSNAFRDCQQLESVTIPSGVTSIEESTFYACYNLSTVTIPDGITSIGREAFSGCKNMKSVTIPDSVTCIGFQAFYLCKSLTEVTIPDGVTSISSQAFNDCSSLTSVVISASVTSIGNYAFSGCTSLTDVYYGGTETQWNAISVGENNESLTNANIHCAQPAVVASGTCGENLTWTFTEDGTLTIRGTGAMDDFSDYKNDMPWRSYQYSIQSVVVEPGVTSIGDYAFCDCYSMKDLTIPNTLSKIGVFSVTSLNDLYFDGTYAQLRSLIHFDAVDEHGSYGFNHSYNEKGFSALVDSSHHYENAVDALEYKINGNTVTILTADPRMTGEFDIPQTIEGKTVSVIDDYAFNRSRLTSVTIPDSVTSIGEYAFSYCRNLISVSIPASVTNIGQYAFTYCTNLASMVIPDSVTSVEQGTFWNCNNMASVVIPDSVTFIGYDAFSECHSLTEVIIPDSVTMIDRYAFNNCINLTSVNIPDSVTSIGYSAFHNNSSMTSVTIPASVTSIGACAFQDCSSLTSVTIPDSITRIESQTFSGCTSLKNVMIPDSVTNIESYAFQGCSSLTSLTIPDGVKYLYYAAFQGCSSLSSVTIPDSITYIDGFVFQGCSSLKNVTFPGGVTSVNESVFQDCTDLERITFKGDINYIGESAFNGCSSLESVQFSGNLNSLGSHAFDGCSALTQIDLPGIDTIPEYAFQYCTSLEQVTIGSGTTLIGNYAFLNCGAMKTLTLPDTLKTVNIGAFRNCDSLKNVYYGGNQAQWDAIKIRSYNEPLTGATLHVGAATPLEISENPSDVTVASGQTAAFAIKAAGERVSYQWQYKAPGASEWSDCDHSDADTLTISATAALDGYQYRCVVTDQDGNTVTSAAATLTVAQPVTIIASPANSVSEAGRVASFYVEAEGEGLTYQWEYSDDNGENWIASTNGSPVAVCRVTPEVNGRLYRCVVTDAYGNYAVSENAVLRIQTNLVITTQPQDYTGAVNSTAKFVIAAEGEGLTYQWQYSDDGKVWDASTLKTAVYSAKLTAAKSGRMVRCVVTDQYGNSVTTVSAMMRIALTITAQPADYVGAVNSTAKFTVKASGAGLSYQWEYSDDGETWLLSSLKSATYSAKLTSEKNGRMVRCVVTDQHGNSVTTVSAVMRIALTITAQPKDYTGAVNSTAKFTVAASGNGLTYQWQYSDDGVTWLPSTLKSATYSAKLTAEKDGRMVRCILTDANGNTVITNAATMKID